MHIFTPKFQESTIDQTKDLEVNRPLDLGRSSHASAGAVKIICTSHLAAVARST